MQVVMDLSTYEFENVAQIYLRLIRPSSLHVKHVSKTLKEAFLFIYPITITREFTGGGCRRGGGVGAMPSK